MSTKTNMNLPKIVSLLCLALLGNVIYLIASDNGNVPDCGASCLAFFNVAFLCQFLPLLSRSVRRSTFLVRGQGVLCAAYFIVEVITAVYLLKKDVDEGAALITQVCILGLFLFLFFFNESANHRTADSLETMRKRVSPSLAEAKSILMVELADAQTQAARDVLRSAVSELSATTLITTPETDDIEAQILQAAEDLVQNASASNLKTFSRLMARRRAMLMAIS